MMHCQVFNELNQYDSSSKRRGRVWNDFRCVMWPVFSGGQDSSQVFEVCHFLFMILNTGRI